MGFAGCARLRGYFRLKDSMSRAPLHLPALFRSFLIGRLGRWCLGLVLVLLGYGLIGFWVLPQVVESVLRDQATAMGFQLQRLGRVTVDPFALTLQIDDLALATPTGQDQVGWAALNVDASWRTLTQFAWVIDAVQVQAPFVRLRRQAGGQIEILDLLAAQRSVDSAPPGPLPRFVLGGLQLIDGQIDFDDQMRHRHHRLAALQWRLPSVSTLPELREQPVDLLLQGVLDGASLTLSGTAKPLAEVPAGKLDLKLAGLSLPPWQGDLPPQLAVKMASGTLSAHFQLLFGQPSVSPSLQGDLQIAGLRLLTTDGQPLLGWQQLDVNVAPSDLFARQVVIERVALHGLTAALAVDRAGQLNLASLWQEAASSPSTAPATPTPAWDWSVAGLSLSDGLIRWHDASRPTGVAGELAQLQMQLGPFDSRFNAPLRFAAVEARLDFGRPLKVDRIRLQGLTIDPADRRVELANFEQQGIRLNWQRLPRGGTRWLTPPRLAEKPAAAPSTVAPQTDLSRTGWQVAIAHWRVTDLLAGLDFPGEISTEIAVDRAKAQEILRWQSLDLSGLHASMAPQQLSIEHVALKDFAGRLLLDANGQLNATALAALPTEEEAMLPASSGTQPRALPQPDIRIGEVRLAGGRVDFTDQFIQPNYAVTVGQLGGTVRGLSSVPGTLAELDLLGRYGEYAPVQITAKFNPLQAKLKLDLKASINAVDLTALSAYAGKYAGYGIRQGVLSMDVTYQMSDGQLNADHHLFIDQLTFGEPVASSQATTLPVQFALALLRNNRGEIDLNLPISGSLDDPKFSVSGLVFKVLGNVLMKAVTSPFTLLSSLFGGGEDLSEVRFAPGQATLDSQALLRLQVLARAMKERPALQLQLVGQADPLLDTPLLPAVLAAKAPKKDVAAQKPGPAVQAVDKAAEASSRALIAEQLQQLAGQRAEVVRTWLQVEGQVEAARLQGLPAGIAADGAASRVKFSLR